MPTHDPLVTAADQVNPMLTAADIMTAGPRTCSPYSTVLEAVLIFRDADCGLVPVLDDGKPVGVLTDRNVALALIEHGASLANRPISDVMTRGVVSVGPDATLDAVKEALSQAAVRRLLVVDSEGRLLGVIAWSDVAPHASDRGVGDLVKEVVQKP